MRPQQNNKNRPRNRNNRKPSNSANRNYESNGPDVKIRGNASHIAEKYSTLARDALSSGDRVVAENYLQHAEHYNRIVLAANALRDEAQASQNRNRQPDVDDSGDDSENESTDTRADDAAQGDDTSNSRPRRRDSRGETRNNPNSTSEREANGREMNGKQALDSTGEQPDAAEGEPKPRTRRTSRKKPELAEGISPDAAALPQGLLGASDAGDGMAGDE